MQPSRTSLFKVKSIIRVTIKEIVSKSDNVISCVSHCDTVSVKDLLHALVPISLQCPQILLFSLHPLLSAMFEEGLLFLLAWRSTCPPSLAYIHRVSLHYLF